MKSRQQESGSTVFFGYVALAFGSLLLLTSVQAYAAEQRVVRYCFSEQLMGTSGRESIDLGTARASVFIRGSADQQTIQFTSEMPAAFFTVPMVPTRAGSDEYSFTFTDGWDDRGEGFVTLAADMAKLHFGEITFPDHGRNGAVNYRDLTLTTAACGG